MTEPYATVIAALYGVGLVLLLAALPARLKLRRGTKIRRSESLGPVTQVDAAFGSQTSSMLAADGKDGR
jgi:hypothetical protein